MNLARSLAQGFKDVAIAPDRAFKAPPWLPVPWSVAIPAAVVIVAMLALAARAVLA